VNFTDQLYDFATSDEDARLCRDIPDEQCREQPRNFLCHVAAMVLSKSGDILADTKVVLPWLLGAVGAPSFLIGMLVPTRESLALLPQVLIGGVIRRYPVRKGFWAASSVIEGICVLLMGLVAMAGLRGAGAGWTIVGLLVVFSLARGVASVAAKDTLGKTISKGRRGRVNGYAATGSGMIAAAVGLYLAFSPQPARPDWLLYAILVAAGCAWFAAAVVFSAIQEYRGATEGGRGLRDLLRDQLRPVLADRELQKFLVSRALMISTALISPIYVSLAQNQTGKALDGLGLLIVAAGLAGTVSATVWGSFSDKSSRLTMATAAALAGALGLMVVAAIALLPTAADSIAFYTGVLFITGIAHSGVRIGRKTHVVDLAGGERKAEYVAVSNTIIGVLLLVTGALTGFLLSLGTDIAIFALSVMALAGAAMALTMQDVQR